MFNASFLVLDKADKLSAMCGSQSEDDIMSGPMRDELWLSFTAIGCTCHRFMQILFKLTARFKSGNWFLIWSIKPNWKLSPDHSTQHHPLSRSTEIISQAPYFSQSNQSQLCRTIAHNFCFVLLLSYCMKWVFCIFCFVASQIQAELYQ